MAKTTDNRGSGQRRQRKPGPRSAATELRALARGAALAALARLTELANSNDERVALAASQELLNRAFGRSPAAASDEPGRQRLVVRVVRFGTAEMPPKPARRPGGEP